MKIGHYVFAVVLVSACSSSQTIGTMSSGGAGGATTGTTNSTTTTTSVTTSETMSSSSSSMTIVDAGCPDAYPPLPGCLPPSATPPAQECMYAPEYAQTCVAADFPGDPFWAPFLCPVSITVTNTDCEALAGSSGPDGGTCSPSGCPYALECCVPMGYPGYK